jgi:E3 ubiquitin-protein ligase UBR7
MHAYSVIRERLTKFLKPFAEQGRIVTKDDVNNFFAEVKQQRESH